MSWKGKFMLNAHKKCVWGRWEVKTEMSRRASGWKTILGVERKYIAGEVEWRRCECDNEMKPCLGGKFVWEKAKAREGWKKVLCWNVLTPYFYPLLLNALLHPKMTPGHCVPSSLIIMLIVGKKMHTTLTRSRVILQKWVRKWNPRYTIFLLFYI